MIEISHRLCYTLLVSLQYDLKEKMSRSIYEANPELIRFETFPRAGHGLSFMVDNKRYNRVVDEFFASLMTK